MIAMMKKMQFHHLDHMCRDDYEGGDETDDEDCLAYKPKVRRFSVRTLHTGAGYSNWLAVRQPEKMH